MAKNKINDLRDHLFEVIEKLQEGDENMSIEKAQTISMVANTIINSARVEVEYMKATGQEKSEQSLFLPLNEPKRINGSAHPSKAEA